ncbi:MAG: hypothetical protein A2W35_03335 [Chloroflexi bacterium RBG_16_57_11]|nr:MAG: hypothetical protein A2W35_03335 [Chloroflexi bacterium RBG_16_57_11]
MIKNVTVFGGSRPDDQGYAQALELGKLLGEAGFAVLTGGYIGTMEAVSRGAAEAGGQVIGVTCDEIEAWRPTSPNPWVMEERRYPTLRQRISALIDGGQAAIALPGGPGTLTEIMEMWNLLLIEVISPRPLILVGDGWRATIEQFFRSFDSYIPEEQRRWIIFADSVQQAVEMLTRG